MVGSHIREMRGGEGVWAKKMKLSRCGLVSGAPGETAMGGGM